jgi:signal transduction histidine kinase
MILSLISQFLILIFAAIFFINYQNHIQENNISDALIIKDQYTLEQISSYKLLGSTYALDLELHNLGDIRKLDSIRFVDKIQNEISFHDCSISTDDNFKLCKINENEYKGISSVRVDGKVLGYILTTKKYFTQTYTVIYDVICIFITIIGIFIVNFWFLFFPIKKKIESNTALLLKLISFNFDSKKILDQIDVDEYKTIAGKFIEERNIITSLQKDKLYYQARKTISEQVAHDIRSPLAALNMMASEDLPIPEKSRILLRNVINRIRDIANDLIDKNRDPNAYENNDCYIQLLTAIIYPIITEKRLELRGNARVAIEFEADRNSYGLFVKINPIEFKRLVSNIINNAIESVDDVGKIKIDISKDEKNIYLIICDNGRGIPPHILNNIGKQKISYGKSGSGLGLFHAKQAMDRFGGTIELMSEVSVGTRVVLGFPKEIPPSWFLPGLNFAPGTVLVVIDDDLSIHHMWNERLHHYLSAISIIHFSSPDEFKSRIISLMEEYKEIFYLFDFEYIGCTQNGLDLIEEFNLQDSSVLVTSHFEEDKIRTRCEKLSVKMIPKDLVAFVPLNIK